MIEEVRRQFRENPKIMAENPADRVDPDYARCVDISTRGALRAMILPGLVAVLTPVAVGVILGPQAEAGLLMVGTMGGIVMALFLNNGGGAWDNAKKYIEAGYLRVNAQGEMVSGLDPNGTILGKKSEAHKASVVGDTVGDPFKDTAGPSLHVLDQVAEHNHAGAGSVVRVLARCTEVTRYMGNVALHSRGTT